MRAVVASFLAALSFAPAYAQVTVGGVPQSGSSPSSPIIENDDERAAYKGGRMFVFTTGNNGVPTNPGLAVPASSFLNSRICNGGTKTWYIAPFGRFFDTSSTVITEYFGITNPDALTTTQAATLTGCGATAPNTCNLSYGSNLSGGAAQTDISMSFGVGTAMMTVSGAAGVPSGNGILYPGMKNEISKPRALPAGKCFGQVAVGQSPANGLGTSTAFFVFRVYIYSDQ